MLRSGAHRTWRWIVARSNEAGQALLFVLIAVALLMSIPLAIATTTVDQLPQTTRNLNWDAAYEAAQAGLNAYIQELDLSANNSTNTVSSWAQASTTPLEYYAYTPSVVAATGLISLKVSGEAGSGATQVVRTFDYTVRPDTSLDDVYWSNYETVDPALGSTYTNCNYFYGQSASYPPSSCPIEFDSNDTLDGPVFSNDTFRMCGTPVFQSTIESGNTYSTSNYVASSGCASSTPNFEDGQPIGVSNTPPQSSIPTADQAAALADGCEFTGNVTLSLSTSPATNPTTTLIAWSGGTLATGSKSWCGSGSSGTITLSAMTAGLIYAGGNISVSGSMTGGLDLIADNNITVTGNLTYPTANVATSANGTESDSSDALGLVALNFIILSPPNTNGMTIDAAILSLTDSFYLPNWGTVPKEGTLTVFGSIAQDFRGPVGTATSTGTVSTGFAKSYHYDTSLQTLWPPYFVPPTSAAWGATSYSECLPGSSNSVLGSKACT
jgi:Tfp pilus assembly protein PilX